MPTFAERVVETRITWHNIYAWKEAYTAEAVDVATGIRAKAKNYHTEGGAKENARKFLKAILLERGIIRKMIEQYVLYFHYNYYSYSYIYIIYIIIDWLIVYNIVIIAMLIGRGIYSETP